MRGEEWRGAGDTKSELRASQLAGSLRLRSEGNLNMEVGFSNPTETIEGLNGPQTSRLDIHFRD
jgi:hypothetical protein